MLIRFSARPPGSPGGKRSAMPESNVIERFFELLERLAPGQTAPETKSRATRRRRGGKKGTSSASARSRTPKVQP
jgi:hypothetical protein